VHLQGNPSLEVCTNVCSSGESNCTECQLIECDTMFQKLPGCLDPYCEIEFGCYALSGYGQHAQCSGTLHFDLGVPGRVCVRFARGFGSGAGLGAGSDRSGPARVI